MSSSIPIIYKNCTGDTRFQFQVLIFTKNYSPNIAKPCYVAWEVLAADQKEAMFLYPTGDLAVGATYSAQDEEIVSSGLFPAVSGTTWSVTQECPEGTVVFKQSKFIEL